MLTATDQELQTSLLRLIHHTVIQVTWWWVVSSFL